VLGKELLNTEFTPLQPSSSVSAALAKMDAWQSSCIPIVEPATKMVAGHIRFEDIADTLDESRPVSDLKIRRPIYTYENQHVFEVARQMLMHEVRMLPVIDSTEQYIGIIEKKQVLEALSTMLNLTTTGSVITIHMVKSDFTLSELVHLIETEGARILGLTVEQPPDGENIIQISLKISHEDTSAVTSSLQRHGYHTTTENKSDLLQIDFTSRADELMRYLDL
jgi:signal-transduction protein with cAMP-binding, CBS, and nucleotidyltransferase domain